MSKLEYLPETTSLIYKDLFENQEQTLNIQDFTSLLNLIKDRVKFLLSNDIQKLINLLYRLDVAEAKVKNAFKLMSEEDIAECIAGHILDREIQKAEFRVKYSNKGKK